MDILGFGFDWVNLLQSLIWIVIEIGVAIGILLVAYRGHQKTGEKGWQYIVVAQIIVLAITLIGSVPNLFSSITGNYDLYLRAGGLFSGIRWIGNLGTGILMIMALNMIMQVAVPKPPQDTYQENYKKTYEDHF